MITRRPATGLRSGGAVRPDLSGTTELTSPRGTAAGRYALPSPSRLGTTLITSDIHESTVTRSDRKLGELCDADHRRTHPTVEALAAAVAAGNPMPDPNGHRANFRAVLDAARTYLHGQPSGRSVKAAAQRLNAAIAALAGDMAKEDS
ncbi:MAG: hypothetical protein JWO67_2075 [Streptosporangiaceae bacterium]|nr:hypothetical protein [Streptosporangiaceae bacterium]